MAILANKGFLMRKEAGGSSFEKLVDITSFPKLGGEPEKVEVTTLSDIKKRYINGLQDTDSLTFGAWFDTSDYERLNEIQEAETVDTYQLWLGDEGKYGIWEWQGKLSVYLTEGSSGAAVGMSITISDEGEEELHYVEQ